MVLKLNAQSHNVNFLLFLHSNREKCYGSPASQPKFTVPVLSSQPWFFRLHFDAFGFQKS